MNINSYCITLRSLVKPTCVTGINMMLPTVYKLFVDFKIGCETVARQVAK